MFKKLLVLLVFPLILGVVVTIGAVLLRSVVRNEQPITKLKTSIPTQLAPDYAVGRQTITV